jgi:hypothetical protein
VASGTTTVPAAGATTTKAGYQAAMQARIDLVAAQCYSTDPAAAAREALQRFRLALTQLRAIRPPADAAHAHRELIAVTVVYARVAARRIGPSKQLSALIRRARADGQVTSDEQSRIQKAQQDLLLRYLPPRAAGKREGDALRELARKGYDVAPKGPAKPEYVRRVQLLVDAAGNPQKALARRVFAPSPLRVALRRLSDSSYRSARALDDITRPAAVASAQNELVNGLCARGRFFGDLAETLRLRPDAQSAKAALVNARDADRIITLYPAAFTEYRRAGYRIHPATGPPR